MIETHVLRRRLHPEQFFQQIRLFRFTERRSTDFLLRTYDFRLCRIDDFDPVTFRLVMIAHDHAHVQLIVRRILPVPALEVLHESTDTRRGHAVIFFDILIQKRLRVPVGIPHQIAVYIGAHIALPVHTGIVRTLHAEVGDPHIPEPSHVLLHDPERGIIAQILTEIIVICPEHKSFCTRLPLREPIAQVVGLTGVEIAVVCI